ncbi:MAG: flagellin [Pseudomonadota bacterium]
MNISGFPNLLQQNLFDRTITTTKQAATIASQELVTGEKTDLARHLGGQAGEYNLITKALADIETDKVRIGLADNRFAQIDAALVNVRDTVNNYTEQVFVSLNTGGAFGVSEIQDTSRAYMSSLVLALNTSHAGRSLFAGDETGAPALASVDTLLTDLETAIGGATDEATIETAIAAYFAPGGDFETNFYQGGTGQAADVKLPNGVDVAYDVKADNQVFRDLFEGFARMAFAPDDASRAYIEDAYAQVSRGQNELTALQANVGRERNLIGEALETNQSEKLILLESKNNLSGVDPYEAAARMQRLQVQLEAAYTVTSRLTRLTLADYL